MGRFMFCVSLAVLALSAATAQPVKLADDPKLQTPITVWLKMEPLRDALRVISRQVGVPLRCQDAIAQEKVCVFVENRSAREILTQMARLLRYEWQPHEEGGYILRVPDKTRLEEERAQNQMRSARLRALRELQRIIREVAQLPPQQRIQEKQRLEARRSELNDSERQRLQLLESLTAFAAQRRMPSGEVEFSEAAGYWRNEPYVYLCLAALPERALNALLEGQWVGLSTKPAQGVYPFPNVLLPAMKRDHTAVQQFTEGRINSTVTEVSPNNPEFVGMWLRLLPAQGVMSYRLLSVPKVKLGVVQPDDTVQHPVGEATPFVASTSGSFQLPLSLRAADSPLWGDWDAWATPIAEAHEALPERAAPAPSRPAPQPTLYRPNDFQGYRCSVADALEWLAWATRRPVVSDAFRTAQLDPLLKPDLSPRALLQPLAERVWIRLDEADYLLVRHKRYWELRMVELPEAWLRPLEAKNEQDALTLWDYVALAGKLSSRQADYLMQTRSYNDAPLTRFAIQPLISCLPALRFLASLSEGQRALLIAGEPLLWSRLTRPQQTRYLEALRAEFPPAQWLFREPMPAKESAIDDTLQNLGVSLIAHILDPETRDQLEKRLTTPPPESLVMLKSGNEQKFPVLVDRNGRYDRYFVSYSATGEEAASRRARAIRDMHQAMQENPDGRFVQMHVHGYLIEFFTADGRFARYAFAQTREQPFELPPLLGDSEPER